MSVLKERLDLLRVEIQKDDFLRGKGLSNEVNIQIFCYDAAEEMTVVHFLGQLRTDTSLRCRMIECNLYKTFLSICDDLGITEDISEMEECEGNSYLLEQFHSSIGVDDFIQKIQYEPHRPGEDVLMLTGVGDVFPFMRVHTLLEAMQPHFSDIPILVMYPGEFDGHYLKLFGRLKPNEYYRAFKLFAEEGTKS